MNKYEDIKQLVSRFMEGETSLDEERRLYDYFRYEKVTADLLPLKEMFCSISTLMEPKQKEVHQKKQATFIFLHRKLIGIAASIIILLAVGSMVWHAQRQDYCEAYIYGKHITDPQQVTKEIIGTLQDLQQEDATNIDDQLHDIFHQ